jgi:predicted branched-subunit amino acid permease
MGLALAPSLRGRAPSRAAFALPLVDASWAAASRGDGTFDPWYLVGVSIPQYVGWVLGTVVGVLIGQRLGDPNALGLDALFPAFSSCCCSKRHVAGAGWLRPPAEPGSRSS